MKKYAPHIEFVSSDEKGMVLRDNRLWCSEDKPKACTHVFYAMGRPEVANLIDLDGKK